MTQITLFCLISYKGYALKGKNGSTFLPFKAELFSEGTWCEGKETEITKVDSITKTCLYNFDPLEPHFYIVKRGFTGVYIIFLISAQKHRLWVFVRTALPKRF